MPESAPGGSAHPAFQIDPVDSTIRLRSPLAAKDWDAIAGVIRERHITGLDAGGQMTDAALERISRLDEITRLNLDGSKDLTDAGLSHLARMTGLRELDLSGFHNVFTDRGLEALGHLRQLTLFRMCWPQRVSDAGVANLAACEQLEVVNLLGTRTGDGAIDSLTGKRRLRRFASGQLVTDAGLSLFHRFPMFAAWHGGETRYELMSAEAEPTHLLVDGPFTDQGLARLSGLDGLFAFSLFWHTPAFTAAGLGAVAGLANLGFLGCDGKRCDDEAMRRIAAMPRLRMLVAQGSVASDAGFEALSRSRTLEYIWGRECPNLGGRGFAAMAAMPSLRGLAVSCKNVDAAALSTLPRFPALKELMPMDVSDAGFEHVGRCTQLEALWCMYCRDTTDAATDHITGLSRLKSYYAGRTGITDKSLATLGQMPSLERLEFWEIAGITDAGVAALAGLPRLREISIEGSPGVSREAFATFPAAVRVSYAP